MCYIDLNTLHKSLFVRCMTLFVSLVSSRVAIIICICLVVLHCGQNPSWLEYRVLS